MAGCPMSLDGEKHAMRKKVAGRRIAQPLLLRRVRSLRVARRARKLSAVRRARVVLAYHPVRGEVDVRPLVRFLMRSGKAVAFPRVAGPGRLVFHRVRSLETGFVPGAFGIPEPAPSVVGEVAPEKADLILVPGVAFSLSGARIGYGGGYYDSLLRSCPGPVAVGLAFEFQVLADLPRGPRDAFMDALVTEKRLLIFGGRDTT